MMDEKRIIIEDSTPHELFKTLKYRMIDAGLYPGEPDHFTNGLQFKFYFGDNPHVMRIEQFGDTDVVVDLSLVSDAETEYLVRQFLPTSMPPKTAGPAESVFVKYDLSESDCILGLDEAGKDDYFGPIVVSGITVCRKSLDKLLGMKLRDSQFYDREAVNKLAGEIIEHFPTTSVILQPDIYNEMYIRHKEMDLILLKIHVRTIIESSEKHPVSVAVINPFSENDLSTEILGEREMKIIYPVGATKHPVTFAAGIVSRSIYLREAKDLSEEYRFRLPQGTGDDVVDMAKSFIKSYGLENLFKVAKVNFKLTGLLI